MFKGKMDYRGYWEYWGLQGISGLKCTMSDVFHVSSGKLLGRISKHLLIGSVDFHLKTKTKNASHCLCHCSRRVCQCRCQYHRCQCRRLCQYRFCFYRCRFCQCQCHRRFCYCRCRCRRLYHQDCLVFLTLTKLTFHLALRDLFFK